MKQDNPSILQKTYSEGYSDGWGQAIMLSHDDSYERGHLEGNVDRRNSYKHWWLFGVLCGVGLSAIVGAFL